MPPFFRSPNLFYVSKNQNITYMAKFLSKICFISHIKIKRANLQNEKMFYNKTFLSFYKFSKMLLHFAYRRNGKRILYLVFDYKNFLGIRHTICCILRIKVIIYKKIKKRQKKTKKRHLGIAVPNARYEISHSYLKLILSISRLIKKSI